MSHISTITTQVAFTDRDLLMKALEPLGEIKTNARIAQVNASGHSFEKYDLVLSERNHSLGLKWHRAGYFGMYYDEWGDLGNWCRKKSLQITDNYLALHYQKHLMEEGYQFELSTAADGSIVIEAEEVQYA